MNNSTELHLLNIVVPT